MAAPVDRDVRRLVGADAERLVGHYYLSLNEQDMAKRVVARVRLSVAGIDVQNVYDALCRFHWDEARAVDMLERDGEPDPDHNDADLGGAIMRQVEEHEFPVSDRPFDDCNNYVNALAILMTFLNHLKEIVGDRVIDDLSKRLFKVLVGVRRPAATSRARQDALEADAPERNKGLRFDTYKAGPFLPSFHLQLNLCEVHSVQLNVVPGCPWIIA